MNPALRALAASCESPQSAHALVEYFADAIALEVEFGTAFVFIRVGILDAKKRDMGFFFDRSLGRDAHEVVLLTKSKGAPSVTAKGGTKSMGPKKYRCEECASTIDPVRAANALSRGGAPRYCSELCSNRAKVRRYRERRREDEA